MQTILPSAILASLLLLSGCGGGGGSTADSTSLNSVTVERGPILGALVVDADGQEANQTNDEVASYSFATPPVYPIAAYGGFIDVNRNGVIDAGEVENTVVLTAGSGEVLTLLTSILSVSDANTSSFFLDDLGLNSALTPTEDLNVAALSDVIYEYLIANNLASVDDINITTIEQLKDLVKLKIEEYDADDLNASEQEHILVLKLDIKKLDDAEATEANTKIKGQEHAADIIANLPNMSDEQKERVKSKILKNSANKNKDTADNVETNTTNA